MHKAFIAIGSNLGDRMKNIEVALKKMEDYGLRIIKKSSIIETEPYGFKEQGKFLNGVILIETDLDPFELLNLLLNIEKEMGRERKMRWGPRNIDLDIIFYDNLVINTDNLKIPHPDAHNRTFVMGPLSEIDPDFVHPVLNKKVKDIYLKLIEGHF
ncbi:MAG: 2-amino-4-hydroxy-6-hydroxymethyldihydropteridine diphosphokinase [Dictyoglomus thermophilum]|nr:2-amino-4-hydroxy-6-hydroxymethyldihydropteridine diphosphokinase [Dictyoglomus thermophilum]MCX7720202.1 2-amino-4-hydroxy-6-hydroxymethyldihydropteridine diphosphokinase [Dictyoglomus thermophilum]